MLVVRVVGLTIVAEKRLMVLWPELFFVPS